MKKLFTLLLLTITAFTFKTAAQNTTTCNANFNFAISGFSVNFTPVVTDTIAVHNYWKFGDGATSSNVFAAHLYSSPGTYEVKHYMYRPSATVGAPPICIDSVTKQVVIQSTTSTCNLHAKFSFERDSQHPNIIHFTNLSTPANDIHYTKWTFGDGSYSYDFNATHTYATSGAYTVCLTVRKETSGTCASDTCMLIQIQIPPPPPVCNLTANFVSYPDSNQINKIHFQNLSTPLSTTDSIRWTFGDGTSSLDINATHVYATAGTYTVCLRVKKNTTVAGTAPCVKEICKQVEVHTQCNLEANYTWHPDATNSNKIYFTNSSTPASSVLNVSWTFGDGSTSSIWSPDHTYAHGGTYNVCLRISSGTACYREICKQVTVIEAVTCLDISKFNFTRSTANCVEFKFEPINKNPNWQYHWTFGDGTGSNDMLVTHVYGRTGTFNVCLTVIKSSDCSSTTCKTVETGACFTCSTVWVKYEYTHDAVMPNKLYFHAISNYPILSQTWTFAKLTPSSAAPVTLVQDNPTYTFPDTGYYRVCLRAITYGGCVKEYCEVIHITQIGGSCTLQSYPNPAHTQVYVNVSLTAPEMIHVYIYNSLNILVKQKDQQGVTGNNVVNVNIETLVPGSYTMRVVYGNHICYSQFQKI